MAKTATRLLSTVTINARAPFAMVTPARPQETEAYLMMCRVWIVTLDSAYLVYNYWKVNLKDADIAFAKGENASGIHDFFS